MNPKLPSVTARQLIRTLELVLKNAVSAAVIYT
jgi:hypothetical protein